MVRLNVAPDLVRTLGHGLVVVADCSLFVFSSRRRHTRYIGDWSSDVCSSDLVCSNSRSITRSPISVRESTTPLRFTKSTRSAHSRGVSLRTTPLRLTTCVERSTSRSEERRVGKEYRSRRRAHDSYE